MQFVEKPDARRAASYLATGEFRWNAGMFVVRAATLMEMIEHYQPRLAEYLRIIADNPFRLSELWPRLTKIAIDHAIAEPAQALGRAAVEVDERHLGAGRRQGRGRGAPQPGRQRDGGMRCAILALAALAAEAMAGAPEDCGLILPLGDWVLETSLCAVVAWPVLRPTDSEALAHSRLTGRMKLSSSAPSVCVCGSVCGSPPSGAQSSSCREARRAASSLASIAQPRMHSGMEASHNGVLIRDSSEV